MQRLSSFSHAWTHVVQYRAQSLHPCPFYHKSQSSEASNYKSTDEATIISLFADSASPSSSSRNHLTALSWTDNAIAYSQQYQSFGSMDSWMQIRRLSRLAGGTCERLTVVSLNGVLRRTHFAKPQKNVDVTAMGKEFKYSYYLHFFVHKASISKLQFAKGH